MPKIIAEFYDGVSSKKQIVSLELHGKTIKVFSHAGEKISHFPVNNINQIEKQNTGYIIELKTSDASIPSKVFLFNDSSFFKQVHEQWVRQQSFTASVASRFNMASLRKKVTIALIGSVLSIALFYAGVVNLYRIVPVTYDVYLGGKVGKQIEDIFELISSDPVDNFIVKAENVLKTQADLFDYQIKVIDHPIDNAIALPGGTIYLFSGLIKKSQSPEEILGIIAHEMGHAQKRHSTQQLIRSVGIAFLSTMIIGVVADGIELFENIELITELASVLIILKYSRSFEKEADLIAVSRLHENQISIKGMIDFFQRLEDNHGADSSKKKGKKGNVSQSSGRKKRQIRIPGYLSTHPSIQDRIEYLEQSLSREGFIPSPGFDTERKNWEQIKKSLGKEPEKTVPTP